METIAVILFVMKANHGIMELGEYKTMEECMNALPVAEQMFKDDHVMCGNPKEINHDNHNDQESHKKHGH